MASIKEESGDIKIEDAIGVKQEDTEEQTGWFSFVSQLVLIKMFHSTEMSDYCRFKLKSGFV